MILKRILINNFNGIQNKTIELSSGINVIYGADETEKNIITVFIKSMFFGIVEEKCQKDTFYYENGGEDLRKIGEGTIWFESRGKNYRLTRVFGSEACDYTLFCADDQKVLDAKNGALEELLDGISEAIFDNAVMIEPLNGNSSAERARELQNKLAVLSKCGDGQTDLGRTEQMLKMWRKGYLTQKERVHKGMQKEQERLFLELEQLESELDDLRVQKGKVVKEQARMHSEAGKEEAVRIQEQIQSIEKKNLGMVIAGSLATIVGIVGIIGRFQVADEMSRLGMDVCMIAAVAAVIYTLAVRRTLRVEFVKQKKKIMYLQSQQEKLKSSKNDIAEVYKEKMTTFTNLQSVYQEYETETALLTSEDMEIQALNLAMDTIEKLSRNIYLQKGRKIRIRASRIYRELTNGRYIELYGDDGLGIELNTENGTIGVESLSEEDLELLYFSVRMAACELLTDEKVFPMVLNDALERHNEKNLCEIVKWMKKQSRQVIVFTNRKIVSERMTGKIRG